MASTYELVIKATDKTSGPLRNISGGLNRLEKSTSKVNGALKTAGAALAAFITGSAIRSIIKTTARFEDLEDTLKSVTGSAKAGAQAFDAIKNFSTRTQFGVEELTNTYIKLAGSGIKPTEKLLTTFTDAAAVTTDQLGVLNAMTDVYSRTLASGSVELQEFDKLQDRGLPVYDILKNKLGVTRGELSKFGKETGNAKKVLDALMDGINERFGGATKGKMDNVSTAMSNFSIAVTNAADTLGQQLRPQLTEHINQITAIIAGNDELVKSIGMGLSDAVAGAASALAFLADNFELLRNVIYAAVGAAALNQTFLFMNGLAKGAARGAFGMRNLVKGIGNLGKSIPILGTVFKLMGRFTPIGTAILAVVGALTYFQDTMVNVGETSASLGEVIGAVFDLALQQITKFVNWVSEGLTSLWDSIKKLIPTLSPEFMETFKTITSVVKDSVNFMMNLFVAYYTTVFETVKQFPRLFVDAFNAILTMGAAFGDKIIEQFSNIGAGIKRALRGDFKGAMEAIGRESAISLSDAFNNSFGEIEGLGIDYEKIFATDRLDQTLEFAKKSGKLFKEAVTSVIMPAYDSLTGAVEKQIIANRAEQAELEKLAEAGNEAADAIGNIETSLDAVDFEPFTAGVTETEKKVKSLTESMAEHFKKATDSFAKNLAQDLARGRASLDSFKDFFKNTLLDMVAMAIEHHITKPMMGQVNELFGMGMNAMTSGGGFGGGFDMGSIFSGITSFLGFSKGGVVPNAPGYGDRVPAMLTPGELVVPKNDIDDVMSSPLTVNFNINSVSTKDGATFILEQRKQIEGVIQDAYNRRGKTGIV